MATETNMQPENTDTATESHQRELLLEARWLAGEVSKLAGLAKMKEDGPSDEVRAIYSFAEEIKKAVNAKGADARFSDYRDHFGTPSEDLWTDEVSEFFTAQLQSSDNADLPGSFQVIGIFTVPAGTFSDDYGVDAEIHAPILEDSGVFNPDGIIPETILSGDGAPEVEMEDVSLDNISLDLSSLDEDGDDEDDISLTDIDTDTDEGDVPEHVQERRESSVSDFVDFDTLTLTQELPPTADGVPEGLDKKYDLALAVKIENPARTFDDVSDMMEERFGVPYSTTSVGNALDRYLSETEKERLKSMAVEARRADESDQEAAEATEEPEPETEDEVIESLEGTYQDLTSLASHTGAFDHYNLETPTKAETVEALEKYGVRMPPVGADYDYELHRGGATVHLTRQEDGSWKENGQATTSVAESAAQEADEDEAEDEYDIELDTDELAEQAREATQDQEVALNIPDHDDLTNLLGNEDVAQNYRAMMLKLAGQATGEGVSESTRRRKLAMARFITEGLSGDRTWE